MPTIMYQTCITGIGTADWDGKALVTLVERYSFFVKGAFNMGLDII